eukprot:scaffold171668_cov22-Tisochrysis_lutea.AAC.1
MSLSPSSSKCRPLLLALKGPPSRSSLLADVATPLPASPRPPTASPPVNLLSAASRACVMIKRFFSSAISARRLFSAAATCGSSLARRCSRCTRKSSARFSARSAQVRSSVPRIAAAALPPPPTRGDILATLPELSISRLAERAPKCASISVAAALPFPFTGAGAIPRPPRRSSYASRNFFSSPPILRSSCATSRFNASSTLSLRCSRAVILRSSFVNMGRSGSCSEVAAAASAAALRADARSDAKSEAEAARDSACDSLCSKLRRLSSSSRSECDSRTLSAYSAPRGIREGWGCHLRCCYPLSVVQRQSIVEDLGEVAAPVLWRETPQPGGDEPAAADAHV